MPKIKITEKDNTGSFTLAEQPNMVYIPGAAASKTKPTVYRTLTDFVADSDKYINTDSSYLLAVKLLRLGMQVLYQGFPRVSGESAISSNAFTIEDVTYTISNNKVTWGESSEAEIDELGCAELEDGLYAKIDTTAAKVTYPMTVHQSQVSIEDGGFEINEIAYLLGNDNEITYNDGANSLEVVNGKVTLANGEIAVIDYLHNVVSYKQVYVNDGSISISDADWKNLEDRNLYNVRFLTTGGYACPTNAMIACAANRGDAIALIDHINYATYDVKAIREYFEGFETATSKQSDTLAFAAGYTPWFTAKLENLDGVATKIEVPASFGYLLAYARSINQNPIWKAVAGVRRGYIAELDSVNYEYSNAECEMLQARATTGEVDLDGDYDNVGMAINPIAYKRYAGFTNGFAFVINGNRTMRINDGATKATSFMNVRVLVSELSKALYDASVANNFEQNNEVLWFKFTSMVTPLLDRMTSGEGIEGYRLIRLATDKKARLKAKLIITPIEAVEDFEIEISLEDSIEVNE